jgi:hypothetical protein
MYDSVLLDTFLTHSQVIDVVIDVFLSYHSRTHA